MPSAFAQSLASFRICLTMARAFSSSYTCFIVRPSTPHTVLKPLLEAAFFHSAGRTSSRYSGFSPPLAKQSTMYLQPSAAMPPPYTGPRYIFVIPCAGRESHWAGAVSTVPMRPQPQPICASDTNFARSRSLPRPFCREMTAVLSVMQHAALVMAAMVAVDLTRMMKMSHGPTSCALYAVRKPVRWCTPLWSVMVMP